MLSVFVILGTGAKRAVFRDLFLPPHPRARPLVVSP